MPEFAEVAFKLDKGQVSDPVKTQFGWHIIKVEDKRTKPVPEFDQVKDQVETFVHAQGAGRLRRQAARRRQDRAAGQEVDAIAVPAALASMAGLDPVPSTSSLACTPM